MSGTVPIKFPILISLSSITQSVDKSMQKYLFLEYMGAGMYVYFNFILKGAKFSFQSRNNIILLFLMGPKANALQQDMKCDMILNSKSV